MFSAESRDLFRGGQVSLRADSLAIQRYPRVASNPSTNIAVMPKQRRTAIAMSRLPRLIDPQATWLCGLRAALRRIQESGDLIVIADGTAGSDFVRRGAERLGIPIEVFAINAGLENGSPNEVGVIPLQDRALMAKADLVLALHVRTNGNIHRALQERLARNNPVEIVDLPEMLPQAVRDDLVERGVTFWSPSVKDQVPFGLFDDSPFERPTVCELVPQPSANEWTFLSHTTRACAGPWPTQSMPDYVDSILDSAGDADHSVIAALERIVTQRKLLAASRMIRGGHAVVCLTAVPLLDLPPLRKFQTHRSRWDFEPYGICIRQQWLQDRGARPVIYGDEATWQSLGEGARPFFQFTSSPSSSPGMDWSVEREWRHVGDLDLNELPPEDGLLFVRHYEDAVRLSRSSPWPITLWPAPAEATSE